MRVKSKCSVWLICVIIVLPFWGCIHKTVEYYTTADFEKVSKIDAHFHYTTSDIRYLEYADSLKFRLITPNTDAGTSIDEQFEIARVIKQRFPDKFTFLGTFSVDSFNNAGFAEKTIARINTCMKAGASGIKIWKNIGMVLKDRSGHFVMIDDPAFKPVFNYLQKNNIPVLAHLGEPRNCWLPLDKMTLGGDLNYYKEHPQYHMYLHPDAPSYEDQINARDNLLQQYPRLDFTGAHLGSLEWSIDELSKRFDRFPKLKVDMAARIGHLKNQSMDNWKKVRDFMIKYQDRIIYGTDASISKRDSNYMQRTIGLHQLWLNDWAYLATDSIIIDKYNDQKKVKGLKLSKEVIDKIYCKNAEQFYNMKKQ